MKSHRRILLATDAWRPQVNGVVRTWETSIALLHERGHTVAVVQPGDFASLPAPFYNEIRLALPSRRRLARLVGDFRPNVVHLATEGPVGLAVRALCLRSGWRFTTSYHSKFPEYLQHLAGIPAAWSYRVMRWFHRPSAGVLVATPSLEAELKARGFGNFRRWSRGVDLELFHPRPRSDEFLRPVMLYVGRVSKEKNIEAFLAVDIRGTKIVVGDGPLHERLERQYPSVMFVGYRRGKALAEVYANADVFVFPSKTDTFGLVMIEAMACGVPVAAYPVVGPIDIVTDPEVGSLDEDLTPAIRRALHDGRAGACIRHASTFTWERCTDQLESHFVPIR